MKDHIPMSLFVSEDIIFKADDLADEIFSKNENAICIVFALHMINL